MQRFTATRGSNLTLYITYHDITWFLSGECLCWSVPLVQLCPGGLDFTAMPWEDGRARATEQRIVLPIKALTRDENRTEQRTFFYKPFMSNKQSVQYITKQTSNSLIPPCCLWHSLVLSIAPAPVPFQPKNLCACFSLNKKEVMKWWQGEETRQPFNHLRLAQADLVDLWEIAEVSTWP